MLSTKTNFHHSRLPKIGEIGYLINRINRFGEKEYWTRGKEKVMVYAFPLCDSVLPWSIGIHTAYFKSLKTGEIKRYSGFYFEDENN